MTLDEAREVLRNAAWMPATYQCDHKAEIVAAFDVVWDARPTREEFDALMAGVVLFPAILYRLAGPR